MKKTLSKIFGVAVVIALLVSMLVATVPASALTISSVTLGSTTISATTTYTISFTGAFNLGTSDTITLTFPSDTDITAVTAGDIIVDDGVAPTETTSNVTTITTTGNQLDITVPIPLTIGNVWTITVNKVKNPSAPGAYALAVATSKETTSVTYTYNITEAVPLTTIVHRNSSGYYLATYTTLTGACAATYSTGDTLTFSAGTFTGPASFTGSGVKLQGVSGTIIAGVLTVSGDNNTLDGFTFVANSAVPALTVSGDGNTVQNCVFQRDSTSTFITPVVGVEFTAGAGKVFTLKNSTVDLTAGDVADTAGVRINGAGEVDLDTVKFLVDNSDIAVSAATVGTLIASGCTFTGADGLGVGYDDAIGATATIEKSTFSGLKKAVVVDAASKLTLDGNTIDSCSIATTSTTTGAVEIAAVAPSVTIVNNVITNNAGYSLKVTAVPTSYIIAGNQFLNNTKGFYTSVGTSATPLVAELNWWGNASGPTTATVTAGDTIVNSTGVLDYEPFLTVAPGAASAGKLTVANTSPLPDGSKEVSGVVMSKLGAGDIGVSVVAQKLAGNPYPSRPAPYPAIAYYDVYTSAALATTPVTLFFYTDGIGVNTLVYWWNGAKSDWDVCSTQGVAGTGKYVYVTLDSTAGTSPDEDSLTGTAFVLVEGPQPAAAAVDVVSPAPGTTLTSGANVPFVWKAYTGATSYALYVYDVSGKVVFKQENLTGTSYVYNGTLSPGSYTLHIDAYVNNAVKAKADSAFIVAAETTTVAPVTTVTTFTLPPQTVTTVTYSMPQPTTVTISTPPVQQITPAWIWALIGIGAVLIIVVIVLIVRTRRVS